MKSVPTLLWSVSAALCIASTAAWAALPPSVYEDARRDAEAIVVLQVDRVDFPRSTPGSCVAHGTIEAVERDASESLREGAAMTLTVMCADARDVVPDGPVLWTDVDDLDRASRVRAWVDQGENGGWEIVRSQSEILARDREPTRRDDRPIWAGVVAVGLVGAGAAAWAAKRRAT